MADDLNAAPEEPLVNVKDPSTGEIGSLPQSQASQAISQNIYQPATDAEVQSSQNQAENGSLPAQIETYGRGILKANTFGTEPYLENSILGNKEQIQKQTEENPISDLAGQATGLLLGTALGTTEARALAAIGEGASSLVGGSGIAAKIGSLAAQAAAENAAYSTTDQVSKMIYKDPNQTAGSVLTDVGLGGAIGGVFGGGLGALHPLWNASFGGKTASALQAVADHAGGIEGQTSDAVNQALSKSQVEAAPEIKAALSQNEQAQEAFRDIIQSPTPSGLDLAKTSDQFRSSIGDDIAKASGYTPQEVSTFSDLSEAKEGAQKAALLAKEFSQKLEGPIAEFEALKEAKANLPLTADETVTNPSNPYENQKIPGTTSQIADDLSQLAVTNKWASDSDAMKILSSTLKRLPEQTTIGDLGKLATRIGEENYDLLNPSLNRDTQQIISKIRDAEGEATIAALKDEAPDLMARHQAARQQWSELSDLKEDLQAKLNLKGGGKNKLQAFTQNIADYGIQNPEKFLQKISNSNDTYLTQTLEKNFPETAAAVKEYQVKDLLSKAASKAKGSQSLNPTTFFNKLNDLSPELRQSLFPAETIQRFEANRTLWETMNQLEKNRNFSNTAPTLARYLKSLPGTALGLVTAAFGHNPVLGAILGSATNTLGRNAPDAMKLAFLKFMGASKPVEAGAFKTMVDYMLHAIQGENLMGRAVGGIFKAGREVLPQALFPDDKSVEKLDKHLQNLQTDPTPLMKIGGKLGYYLPDHATSLAQTSMAAVNYLNSIRPQTSQPSPLDSKIEPTKAQKADFHEALSIAQQPLIVLPRIKEGTLTVQDIQHLQNTNPDAYNNLRQKLSEAMIEAVHDGYSIPYKTRMGLSLFLGQPLDSTMTPEAIRMNQQAFQGPAPSQPPTGMPPKGQGNQKHSMNSLNKLVGLNQTPSEARAASKVG